MKKIIFVNLCLVFFFFTRAHAQDDFVTISGIVSDFEGNPINSAVVELKHSDFQTAYETLTDLDGKYKLKVLKGEYLALTSIRMDEYPLDSVLPKEKQRLEFWSWNVIAEEDMILNIKYHRLEIYGVNVFRIQGATPGYTIYCRPMSLTRGLAKLGEKELCLADLCPPPKELDVNVEIDGQPVKINMKQKIKEYVRNGVCYGYILHIDLPEAQTNKNYNIFHIQMTDLKNGDKGEAVYFMKKPDYR